MTEGTQKEMLRRIVDDRQRQAIHPIVLMTGTVFLASFLNLFGFLHVVNAEPAVEPTGGLVGEMKGHKVVVDPKSGEETLLPAEEVVPGDTIEYTLTYKNHEQTLPLKEVVIATPIPTGTVWIFGAAHTDTPGIFEASIDGGKSFKRPPILIKTTGPDGKEVEVEAPAEAYTNLRWSLSETLPPGGEVRMRYRVTVR